MTGTHQCFIIRRVPNNHKFEGQIAQSGIPCCAQQHIIPLLLSDPANDTHPDTLTPAGTHNSHTGNTLFRHRERSLQTRLALCAQRRIIFQPPYMTGQARILLLHALSRIL
ncbi:hypothetical protein Amal_03727 [Acetobacter malorum]|uniref:Uncharacterized protein n=1 Tax=Acetobacter malorum TaxID=178901 RepID=A0A177G6W6_9PROT|nr:hypothetical protein Amal_03727 [Acetobacter malorum]